MDYTRKNTGLRTIRKNVKCISKMIFDLSAHIVECGSRIMWQENSISKKIIMYPKNQM